MDGAAEGPTLDRCGRLLDWQVHSLGVYGPKWSHAPSGCRKAHNFMAHLDNTPTDKKRAGNASCVGINKRRTTAQAQLEDATRVANPSFLYQCSCHVSVIETQTPHNFRTKSITQQHA